MNYVSDLSKDLNEEKKCSLELIKKGTIFNKSNNSFTKSGLHVSREMASKIIDSLEGTVSDNIDTRTDISGLVDSIIKIW